MSPDQTSQLLTMNFPERLTTLRKDRKLTQQALADTVGVHLSQIRRYESGETQPTLEVIKQLAIALSVSADMLIFDKDERGPGEDFQMQFEALSGFNADEKRVAKEVLDSLILKHTANRLTTKPSR